MNTMMRRLFRGTLSLLIFAPASATGTDASLRKLLSSDDFATLGIATIFAHGESSIPKLLDALEDTDSKVALHAQLMLRLIGDERGIKSLQGWYDKPRPDLAMTPGPVPVPITEWDYRQIDAI